MKRKDLVKTIRTNMSMTQAEFGIIMGVTRTGVTKWETGQRDFDDSRIFELYTVCALLGNDYYSLFEKTIDNILISRMIVVSKTRIQGTELTISLCEE